MLIIVKLIHVYISVSIGMKDESLTNKIHATKKSSRQQYVYGSPIFEDTQSCICQLATSESQQSTNYARELSI